MRKLQDYWAARTARQKAVLAAVFAATFLAVTVFGWLASRPNMALLYGGLDPARAGEVIAGVERAGVPYRVGGDSIWVEQQHRDRLRMELASQGLPASGGAGYEILDGMSGFGTTSQMFDAAYWRAKEGELARTVLALPSVKSARVHLAVDNGRGYRRGTTGAAASVTLTTNGAAISREQASALRYLVSSGVPGMLPENVTVIDSQRGIVASSDNISAQDRAAEMKRNVERILEPHVGVGNAIVELNMDLVTETERLSEQRVDPDLRALISEVKEETTDQSNATGSGAVTAASNLPDNEQAQGDRNESARSEARQQSNYEVSTVRREVSRQPGAIRRLTVAVLVNGAVPSNADAGSGLQPRSDAELQVLRELVASAVGLDEDRGDTLTVKSLPFTETAAQGTAANDGFLERLEPNALARILLVGVFALMLALVLARMMSRNRNAGQNAEAVAQIAPRQDFLDDSAPGQPLPENMTIMPAPRAEEHLSLPSADPVARLRGMMRDRREESVKILSGWIDDKKGAA